MFDAEILSGCMSVLGAGVAMTFQTVNWNHSPPSRPNWWAMMLRTHGARWAGRSLVSLAVAESGLIQWLAQWLVGS